MPSPYLCERYHPTRGCSQRKSLFLNFANENAKEAPPGFERETRGDLSSHSYLSSRLNERRHHGWQLQKWINPIVLSKVGWQKEREQLILGFCFFVIFPSLSTSTIISRDFQISWNKASGILYLGLSILHSFSHVHCKYLQREMTQIQFCIIPIGTNVF